MRRDDDVKLTAARRENEALRQELDAINAGAKRTDVSLVYQLSVCLSVSRTRQQIQFRPGLRLTPCWGAYSAPSEPLAGFRSPTSKGKGKEKGREG